ncbi:ABC transporter substrate-binding protein [Effusibacillus lacus]|uniref:Peptide ABC transporter substrate-binding protein n=1 Tax=Effusibacillus lacus TaxID=1348429 RepID=A0A292YME8_9BACL|nr:ABC transporter substrate-binding protein [Effusibacillus lacus]TCS69520.1 peptide/nickel transport system substrate-binding protein [Effusibacillus lacus]GAX90069.1 peptide ABC transporter substrate-binding protein [Effusibacillus lacus]
MNKKFRLGLTAVLAGSLLLAGCGGGDKPAANGGDNAPKTGGSLNIAINADPPKLDPSFSTALVERQVFQSLYDTLLELKPDGTLAGELAEKWEVSEDKKTYTFKLRQGVKFHDGTDFNAEAVKFNFERYMDKASTRRAELEAVENVSAVDANTVKVTLKKPFAPFLSVLADRAGMMVSPAAVKKYGEDFVNNPVGTGPFKFKERVKGDKLVLEKNPNYWQKGLPKLDSVTYKVINSSDVQLVNLKSGQVDIIDKFPDKEVDNVKNDPKIKVINELSYAFQGIHINVTKPPFDKKELRQAVDLLIDREAIVKVALHGTGAPAHSPFAKGHFAYGDSDKAPKPDLAKAKELLAKAGVPNGFSFTLTISTTPLNQQIGSLIQGMLKPAGIDVQLEKVEFGQMLEKGKAVNHQALMLGWSGRPDPDQNIYQFMKTKEPNNYTGYSNTKVDELLLAARTETDTTKRKGIYDEAMKILNDELPYIYTYHEANLLGFSKSVQGFEYVPDGLIRTANLSK